jgi:hypothetical protein
MSPLKTPNYAKEKMMVCRFVGRLCQTPTRGMAFHRNALQNSAPFSRV